MGGGRQGAVAVRVKQAAIGCLYFYVLQKTGVWDVMDENCGLAELLQHGIEDAVFT